MNSVPSFEDFVAGLRRLSTSEVIGESESIAQVRLAARSLASLPDFSPTELALWLQGHPEWLPALALVVDLSLEQLRNFLKRHFDTSGWKKLVQSRSDDVVLALDNEFNLLSRLASDRDRTYSFEDILVERGASRSRAGAAITRGRELEDQVQLVATDLGLPSVRGSRFTGRNGRTAPADIAIPGNFERAVIVCGVKGFDSTGSKLTDAVREVESMAEVRLPSQFVFAIVDGEGWLRRQADLARIYELWATNSIDGLYSASAFPEFREALRLAANRVQLL